MNSKSRAHDHEVCMAAAHARAEKMFVARGLKLTALRRRVFEEIARSHDAVGAYDVLDRLARTSGERIAPISVYRALDALLEAGVVHRLESRNAFFACHAPHAPNARHIALLCETCGTVNEIDGAAVHAAIDGAVSEAGFTSRQAVVEISGRCASCGVRPADGEATATG
jgi:Fur family zinc uptake transcriptional regulator